MSTELPLFLHCRAAGEELLEVMHMQGVGEGLRGVVHSFDGTEGEREAILERGLSSIGINGCSLKTVEITEDTAVQ